ncbi:MAG: HD domain-containing protein [Spirochaetales bacterium]|nr:HD domain-containing protein [Spirochaetales bacterium]
MSKNQSRRPLTASPNELLKTIFSYVGRIADERDIDQLLILLADMGRDLISADRCTVWLLNRKTKELWSKVAHGVDRIVIPCSAGIAGCVAMTGESLIINDPYNDSRFDKEIDKKTGYHTRNILGLPINDGEGKIIGVFQAINKVPEPEQFSRQDLEHLLLAATYTGKTLDAAMLQEEIEATQREIIFTLAETGELRSKETGYHVKRVAEFCRLFAEKYGLGADDTELLRLSSPMHDIGKIAIPDRILLKPGKLDAEEWETMKTHTTLGYEMLKHSERRLLKAAALIANEHHERWDGKGYPGGVKGKKIHIYGRITAMSDVFDALANERVYKPAWEMERIVKLFREEKGRQFDPDLVKVFLDNFDRFVEIKETYRDAPPAAEIPPAPES